MTEQLTDVLNVMRHDSARIERGLIRLQREIQSFPERVGVASLDLDGSAAVRARGLAAKRSLVARLQEEVKAAVPAGAVIVDSGTRDEVAVALPGFDPARTRRFAEALRTHIKETDFTLDGETVRLTTSIGVADVSGIASAEEMIERGQESLALAKSARDCVAEAPMTTGVPIECTMPEHVLAALLRDGEPLGDVLRRGIRTLQEKHRPMWYWVAEHGGVVTEPGDPASDPFFDLLVSQIRLEDAVTRAEAAGTSFVFRTSSEPPGGQEFAVRYLPGEWVVAEPATTLIRGNVFLRVQRARERRRGVPAPVAITLRRHTVDALNGLCRHRGRELPDLLTEAATLEADRIVVGDRG